MTDEAAYAQALRELEGEETDPAAMAKAIVAANGDDTKLKAQYIKLRVAQLNRHESPGSLDSWYEGLDQSQRIGMYALSIVLIPVFGLGMIALIGLLVLRERESAKAFYLSRGGDDR